MKSKLHHDQDGVRAHESRSHRVHCLHVEPDAIQLILDGRRSIAPRLSAQKEPPFGEVDAGDVLVLASPDGEVLGIAVAERVQFFADLCAHDIWRMSRNYNYGIQAEESFWTARSHARFATLVYLSAVTAAPRVKTRAPGTDDWVVLEDVPADWRPLFDALFAASGARARPSYCNENASAMKVK